MNTDTLEIDGYTVTIAQDESPENPMTAFDCEPPLIVYNPDRGRGDLTAYNGAPETLADFARLIPDAEFARGKRLDLLKCLDLSVKEVAQYRHDNTYYRAHTCPLRDAVAELLHERHGKPEGWRSAGEWFDCAETLLTLAGIPFHCEDSHGYCQGDTVKLLAFTTPEWCTLVGAPADSLERQCKAACDLYSAWAWGDVYGISSIAAPDSTELEDGSVWGFYGGDHEASGLLDSARDTINWHKEETHKREENRRATAKLVAEEKSSLRKMSAQQLAARDATEDLEKLIESL